MAVDHFSAERSASPERCASSASTRADCALTYGEVLGTTSPVSVLRVTSKGFAALLETSPTIQRKIQKALADRVAPTAL